MNNSIFPAASGGPELTVNYFMSSIQKAVKSKSKHAIASLPGNILRLSRAAGNMILKAKPPKNNGTLEGFITGRLAAFEQKSGINYHFTNLFEAGAQPLVIKEHLMRAAFSLQLHSAANCNHISMVVVKMFPENNQVVLSLAFICMDPCEALEHHAAGFKKLERHITRAGGILQHTSEPGSSYTLEISLPLFN